MKATKRIGNTAKRCMVSASVAMSALVGAVVFAAPAGAVGLPITNPTPNLSGLGNAQNIASTIVNWVEGAAFVAVLLGVFIGCAMWVFGSHSSSPQYTQKGKGMVLIAFAGAIVLGAGAALIGALFNLGAA